MEITLAELEVIKAEALLVGINRAMTTLGIDEESSNE